MSTARDWVWTLDAKPDAVALARQHVRRILLAERVALARVDDAVLLTSEVVANATLHGHGPLTMRATREGRRWTFSVSDTSPELPRPQPHSLDALGGRGLQILDAIADSWGVQPNGQRGKQVWFQLTS
ncbi:MAG TPA: ATP-binding protein [Mycobacteriales bacterium]|nr:ATP-binding protein [Mycobacteriales bacterium]